MGDKMMKIGKTSTFCGVLTIWVANGKEKVKRLFLFVTLIFICFYFSSYFFYSGFLVHKQNNSHSIPPFFSLFLSSFPQPQPATVIIQLGDSAIYRYRCGSSGFPFLLFSFIQFFFSFLFHLTFFFFSFFLLSLFLEGYKSEVLTHLKGPAWEGYVGHFLSFHLCSPLLFSYFPPFFQVEALRIF